jgi:hypothetical protein
MTRIDGHVFNPQEEDFDPQAPPRRTRGNTPQARMRNYRADERSLREALIDGRLTARWNAAAWQFRNEGDDDEPVL